MTIILLLPTQPTARIAASIRSRRRFQAQQSPQCFSDVSSLWRKRVTWSRREHPASNGEPVRDASGTNFIIIIIIIIITACCLALPGLLGYGPLRPITGAIPAYGRETRYEVESLFVWPKHNNQRGNSGGWTPHATCLDFLAK